MEQGETEEGLKRRAYSEAMKLKRNGFDRETVYIRLEKQGIPAELAKKVIADISTETKKEVVANEKPKLYMALIGIVVGILLAVLSSVLLPDKISFQQV
ncbi:MAG: hypothetical protein ACI85I_002213 [Arenicella sp.]|jgi:hypothetical protein